MLFYLIVVVLVEVVVAEKEKGKVFDCFPFWRIIITFFKGQWDSLQIYVALKPLIFSLLLLDITDAWKALDLLFAFLQYVFFYFFKAVF